ncbi:MAG: hypothetical protein RMK20_03720, partial [Verrucomicrobiales bacterium]|nr:hypothetical protein [Verrucomicrobiales bacterium]
MRKSLRHRHGLEHRFDVVGRLLMFGFARSTGGTPEPSGQFDLQLATEGQRRAFQKLEGERCLLALKQPVERGATGLHSAGELSARDPTPLPFLLDLPGDDTPKRTGFTFSQHALLPEEIVK